MYLILERYRIRADASSHSQLGTGCEICRLHDAVSSMEAATSDDVMSTKIS